MINKILPITLTKLRILTELYKFEELNLAELSRKLDIPSSNLLKTIPGLLSILQVKEMGNIKLYSIDKKYLNAIETLIENYRLEVAFGVHRDLIKFIEEVQGIRHLFIFGSHVKGSQKKDSDIDVIIVTEKKKEVEEKILSIKRLSPISIEISYLNFEKYEKTLNENIGRFGNILNDKSQRIKVF